MLGYYRSGSSMDGIILQSVAINYSVSSSRDLKFGVPQGSVLGLVLFSLYTSSMTDIIQSHRLKYHLYADDTQLYLAFNPYTMFNESSSLLLYYMIFCYALFYITAALKLCESLHFIFLSLRSNPNSA